MSDLNDVSQVIKSALEEIGFTGDLDVKMGGVHVATELGATDADQQHVKVDVTDFVDTQADLPGDLNNPT